MNSYERSMAAIHMKPVDWMPTDLHNFLMCAEASGMGYDRFVKDGKAMAEMQIKLWKEFGQDMLLVENGTAALAEALGCPVVYRKAGPPAVHAPLLTDPGEIRNLRIPEDFWESPMVKANIEAVRRLGEYFGDQVFVMGRGDQGPFSLASLLYGMEKLLIDLMDEDLEEDIQDLLAFCTRACILYEEKLLEAGAHGTSMGDSTAGPDVISPAMYETFAMPWEKQVIDAVHKAGGLISLHICGNATSIMPQMCSLGADILEIDEKTDLKKAVEEARGKCALLGQISPLLLRRGTKEQIEKALAWTVAAAGGREATGFILGPGCGLAGDTPGENVRILTRVG
ncbi:MAG: hypothetical protein HFI31_06245 [Lachnospiraceae bacterium]|nr:hypothetical protein [Lachnospiraceae bacterium]MCI9133774.1 hypothetical protein [Lachnospiraceae bacterium]